MLRNTFGRWVTIVRNTRNLTFAGGALCSEMGGNLWSEINLFEGGQLCPETGGIPYTEIGGGVWSEIVT